MPGLDFMASEKAGTPISISVDVSVLSLSLSLSLLAGLQTISALITMTQARQLNFLLL